MARVHRLHWDPDDPAVYFETFFAIGLIMSSWRLFYFFEMDKNFRAVIVSVGRCVRHVFLYICLYTIIIIAFGIGVHFLYKNYAGNVVIINGRRVEQTRYMTTLLSCVRYLYWAWYGYLHPTFKLMVAVGNRGPEETVMENRMVNYAGELICGIYYVITVVALVHLMTSMMAKTASRILANEDIETKYVQCQISAEYFQDSRSVPPPFNLILFTVNGVLYAFRKLINWMKTA
ncbi:unnamed protein product [Soboliphyme baturini]|uniref:G protein-coupled receptor n=1 Tax=Soboliphyme baturini TaxID=241478 RepID=A0A183IJK7_9BILA|nr:unnamed protein product [Soboliphyme baturini]